jgi:hypothetical protein
MASDAKTLVDQAIKENKVLMFGKTYCPVSFSCIGDGDGRVLMVVLQEG